jgi:putative flippase GtrA
VPLPALSLVPRVSAFVAVGALCLAVNTLVLWGLTAGAGIHYLISTVIAFLAITPLGFTLNKLLTFRTRRRDAPVEIPRYFTAMAASIGANLALMYLLVSVLGMWYVPASVIVAAILVGVNFLTSDRWCFRARR